ncbi:MAG: short-chain dehydrogenase [Solirubrobacterales bacterium]|nr:short-chain dehydrogenase [Solirubrobacterales bacterium]
MADVMPAAGALVVGGASGIGRATADELAARGWRVVVADLRPPSDVASLPLDVRDAEAVRAAVEDFATHCGSPWTVVYAAGTARVTPLADITAREWELVLAVNLTGAFNVVQSCARALAGEGSVTLLSSIDSRSPVAGLTHYCAAKAGLEALVRSAALELGSRGIRCNAVAPGVVRTPLMEPMLAQPGVSESFVDGTPLGRIAEGADIAAAVAFLASPAARWITGTCLTVDGGLSLRGHPALLDDSR